MFNKKSGKKDKKSKCTVHKRRAAESQCPVCGKGVCHECAFINEGLCGYCNELARGGLLRQKKKAGDPEEKKAAPKKAPVQVEKKSALLAVTAPILIGVAALLLVLHFAGFGPFRIKMEKPTDEELARTVKSTVLFAVNAIENHKVDTEELPEDLSQVGLGAQEGWEYTVYPEGGYKVTFTYRGQFFTYQSFQDPEEIFADLKAPRKGGQSP